MPEIQNIYDNKTFFESYKKLRQNNQGFNSFEQSAIHELLPNFKNKNILDIGCGFGEFCRYARSNGAIKVLGIDPSINMIQEAINLTSDNAINYQQVSIEHFQNPVNEFDLIVSSLAFHYVEDFNSIIKKISNWLIQNGILIFSVEHPICTSYPDAKLKIDETGQKFHPIYNYRDEKAVYQNWFIEGVKKFHRQTSTYINTLIDAGFTIIRVVEPMPTDELINDRIDFSVHKIRPPLLIIKAIKLHVY